MVTTQLDFLHLRTTVGLARQVRLIARRMRWKHFESKIAKGEEKLKQAMAKGQIDEVKEAFEDLLKVAKKKEDYLYIIEKDELILLNEEEKVVKKEFALERDLKPFLDQLAKRKPELFKEFKAKIDDPLNQVMGEIHKRTDQIRRVLGYLKADNVGGISRRDFINSIRAERGLERSIGREARFERKYVKGEKSGLHNLYGIFNQIVAQVKSKQFDKAEKNLERFFKTDKKIFKELNAEVNYIYDIITKDTYMYVKLLELIKDKLFQKLKQLEEEKYLPTALEELKKEEVNLLNEIYDHIKTIYGLGRYQEIHAR